MTEPSEEIGDDLFRLTHSPAAARVRMLRDPALTCCWAGIVRGATAGEFLKRELERRRDVSQEAEEPNRPGIMITADSHAAHRQPY